MITSSRFLLSANHPYPAQKVKWSNPYKEPGPRLSRLGQSLCKKKKNKEIRLTNFDFVVRGPESLAQPCLTPGGGGESAYERGGDPSRLA